MVDGFIVSSETAVDVAIFVIAYGTLIGSGVGLLVGLTPNVRSIFTFFSGAGASTCALLLGVFLILPLSQSITKFVESVSTAISSSDIDDSATKKALRNRSNILKITDDNFDREVMGSNGTVLIQVWATWAGPSKQLAPAIQELADSNKFDVTVAKLDSDENPSTIEKLKIRAIPTLILFRDKKVIGRKEGALKKEVLIEWIDETLSQPLQ